MSILAIDQQKSGLEALKRSASIHQDWNFWDFSLLEANLPTGRIREFWFILMDLGRPINEGIDYGQVCGAFIQGMGCLEC